MSFLDNLPPHVRRNGLACGWLYESRQGSEKPAKVPQNLQTGKPADPSNPNDFVPMSSLANFDFRQYGYDGIGLGIFGNICAIDIDHCIDDTGNYSPMARDIINTMQSYTEISPSGHGIRILFIATDFNYDKAKYYINNQKIGLEVYVAGATNKYVSLTGNAICKVDLVESGDLLQIVLDKYMLRPQHSDPKVQLPVPTITLDDTALLEKACGASNGDKFTALFSGDTSEYGGDDSAADMALCNMLAYWTGHNAEQMDRLFRQSGLMRNKWDRPTGGSTYGQITIAKAIAGVTQVHAPQTETTATQPVAVQDPASDPATCGVANSVSSLKTTESEYSSLPDLVNSNFPPVEFVIENFLSFCTTILAAAPKIGKSWLVLLLAICVSLGKPFLGFPTHKHGVLYLALEDSLSRLKERVIKVLDGETPPDNCYIMTSIPNMDMGFFPALDKFLEQHKDVRLIIIDTLQVVRGSARRNETLYTQDYRQMRELKTYMDKKGLACIIVHHTRKQKDDEDVYARVSGSQGVTGGLDGSWVITQKNRNSDMATLNYVGRDVCKNTITISFNKDNCHWELVGKADDYDEQDARARYKSDPIVRAIKKLLYDAPNGEWSGSASELISKANDCGICICSSPQGVGKFLMQSDELLEEFDQILHWTTKVNGSGSKQHHFKYAANGDPTIGERIDPTVDDPDEAYDDDDELPSRQEDYRYTTEDEKVDLQADDNQYA